MYSEARAANTNPAADAGELSQIGHRIEKLVSVAQNNRARLEEIVERLLGPTPSAAPNAKGASSPASAIGKLHEVCGHLEANLESIAESTDRLSRL